MQSQSSMTSGLLTLSVHEALTFDGVEIALHPDLFSGTTGGIQGRHSRDASYSSSITMQGRHTRDASFSSLGGVSGRNVLRQRRHFLRIIVQCIPHPQGQRQCYGYVARSDSIQGKIIPTRAGEEGGVDNTGVCRS